jgi:hypothetical protein
MVSSGVANLFDLGAIQVIRDTFSALFRSPPSPYVTFGDISPPPPPMCDIIIGDTLANPLPPP